MNRLLLFRMMIGQLLCIVLLSCNLSSAAAQTQRLGYTIKYQDAWPRTGQMKYIRVTIKPVAATAADDYDFYVVASNNDYQTTTIASTRIPIRRGDTSAVGEIYIPATNGYNFSIHTEIDGNLKSNRNDFAKRDYYDYSNSYSNQYGSPTFLLASSKVIADESVEFTAFSRTISPLFQSATSVATDAEFPALDDLELWYKDSANSFAGGRTNMSINGLESPFGAAMSLESLPSKWFGYDGLDLLMITHEDLAQLASKHPGKLLAIERWVAASGRLVVLDCGEKIEKAVDALKLLGDSNARLRDGRRCSYPSKQPTDKQISEILDNESYSNPYQLVVEEANTSSMSRTDAFNFHANIIREPFAKAIESDKLKDIVAIDFELGQVICLSNNASDWDEKKKVGTYPADEWGPFALFVQAARPTNLKKHRVLAWDTIRGLGFPEFDEPPRYVFELSILLYLLVIGPFTFFVLKRKHKLNLMFVVVPVVSTFFCISILAYAIFAEGFDTRVNLFTFTSLNQNSGRQSTSGVAHVYSGRTPAAYRLGASAYGMINLPSGGRTQRIMWDEDGEELSGGEIRARTNHQLFSISSGETNSKLRFTISDSDDSTTAIVRNEFEHSVVAVAFRSDDCGSDEVWLCEDIAVGDSKAAVKMSMADANSLLRSAIRERGKSSVMASNKPMRTRNSRNNYYYGGSSLESADSMEIASRVSRIWNMQPSQLKGYLSGQNKRHYLAITENCVDYKIPIENAKLETKIHIVSGVR